MVLAVPSTLDQRVQASSEAPDNLRKILRLNAAGGKEQVATRLTIECFNRAQALRPGYFDGVKSWVKSGVVYLCGGTAALGAVGLGTYGVIKAAEMAYSKGYALHCSATLGIAGWISSELGIPPVRLGMAFLAVAVRDAAVRAAKWSTKQDEKTLEENAKEAQECRKQICNQMLFIFDDVAQHLRESYAKAEQGDPEEVLRLKQIVDDLERKIPSIETVLKKFDLTAPEIENILQKFKNAARYIQVQSYELKPKDGKRNAELLAAAPAHSLSRIAVPVEMRERIAAAKQNKLGIIGQLQGYGRVALSGTKALLGGTVVGGVAGLAYAVKEGDIRGTFNALHPTDYRVIGAGLGILGITGYAMKKSLDHESSLIESNAEYVEKELAACRNEMRDIYQSMIDYVTQIPDPSKRRHLIQELRAKHAVICQEIQKLGITQDALEIVPDFNVLRVF